MIGRLWRRLLWCLFKERILRVMVFSPPQNFPVPIVTISPLGIKVGVWAFHNGMVNICQVACFVQEPGAANWSAIGGGHSVNKDPAAFKAYVDATHGGDERKYLQVELLDKINKQIDDYLRANWQWEQVGGAQTITLEQINALPSEVDQINAIIGLYSAVTYDAVKKTVQWLA